MSKAEVIALAGKASRGSKESFEKLCRIKTQEIIFSALMITGNMHDAEDAAQEALLDMHRYIGRLRNPEAVNTWIMRIVKSKCVAIIDKRGGRPGESELDIDGEALLIADEDKDFLPEVYAENEELGSRLYEIVLSLPEKRREAILMYYYEDMSYKEIASITGTSIGTVSTNLQRARMMIQERLKDDNADKAAPAPQAGASSTVLGSVLHQQAAKRVTEDTATAAANKFFASTAAMKFPAAQMLAAKAVVSSAAAAVAVAAAVVAGGAFFGAGGELPADVLQGRAIAFSGSDCECGHLNPGKAALEGLNQGDVVSAWKIVDAAGAALAGGATQSLSMPEALKTEGPAGEYTMVFTIRDAKSNIIEIDRKFVLGVPTGDEE
ncbi:MAG: RNA polymerase sigma factor [Clostridiales Family XIII bacterium]|jgi:RNA polymerase sigma-70 factor (ECF subfamily)|nr:RNA polymerase sigma factor [Clostridiales Family XIII bacterium]